MHCLSACGDAVSLVNSTINGFSAEQMDCGLVSLSKLSCLCARSPGKDEECSRKCSTSDVPEVSAVQGTVWGEPGESFFVIELRTN